MRPPTGRNDMKINYKIVSGVLTAVLAYDGIVAIRNRKNHMALVEHHKELHREYDKAVELTNLYAMKLNEYDVPMDDFTRIIMDHLTD